MTTYRACYFVTDNPQSETVLTLPEHAHLDDCALTAEAMAEAERADLVGEHPRVPYQELLDGLTIGDWTE
jgi:hypothetical protein